MNTFGEKLKELRLERGMTITALSEATGIARRTLYDWERGKRVPASFSSWEILTNACQVDVSYFFEDKNDQLSIALRMKELAEKVDDLEKRIMKLETF